MEGVDDVYKFQQMESDKVRSDDVPELDYSPVSASRSLDPDQLYFNDMDIRAWENRTATLDQGAYLPEHGYQEDEACSGDYNEAMTLAEYEEVLFQRVLDKIRLARAAGIADVQLTQEEIEAYQSKLHGTRPPAVRSPGKPRSGNTSNLNDTSSLASLNTASKSGSSRSKRSPQRSSLFASKPKKKKPPGRNRAVSNVSNVLGPAPPGFVTPGPDGRPTYTPINAPQGDVARNLVYPYENAPRTPLNDSPKSPALLRSDPPRVMPGAFPGALPGYTAAPESETRTQRSHQNPDQEQSPRMMPFPVEPYHYHTFSQSSSSQSSPRLQYTRRVSSAESSFTAMPRRVPVPDQRLAPPMASSRGSQSDPALVTGPSSARAEQNEETISDEGLIAPQFDSSTKEPTGKSSSKAGSSSGGRKDEERKRKGGRTRKKH
jgi:hypothetical protein